MAESLAASLSANEKRVLLALREIGRRATDEEVRSRSGLESVREVVSAANWLRTKAMVTIDAVTHTFIELAQEGRDYAERGFPEVRALRELVEREKIGVLDLLERKVIAQPEVQVALGWLRRKGWADIAKSDGDTILTLTEKGRGALDQDAVDEIALRRLLHEPVELAELETVAPGAFQLLRGRQNVIKLRDEKRHFYQLTTQAETIPRSELVVQEQITELTRDDIASRKWEKVAIRPFDPTTVVPPSHGGRPNPLVLLIEKIRDIFIELGFAEIEGPFVESAFWNMDTLFIPQDHPAREMQDTFYLDNPASLPVPAKLLKTVKDVQLTGGKTSSTGWGGSWSDDESKRALLRTHTTVTTVRYLSENPKPPSKVFGIGKVFRKEAIDATHLPEFHQVEGIVVEEGANFRMLQGVLGEFYKRMGFPQIKFRPSYYPYTEPSLDVAVKWGDRWLELGGAGIFRPEVTEPLGVPCPVLAWGLGLERLAMLTFKLTDIRQLYISDVDWLRKAPIVLPEPGSETRTNHGEPGGGEP